MFWKGHFSVFASCTCSARWEGLDLMGGRFHSAFADTCTPRQLFVWVCDWARTSLLRCDERTRLYERNKTGLCLFARGGIRSKDSSHAYLLCSEKRSQDKFVLIVLKSHAEKSVRAAHFIVTMLEWLVVLCAAVLMFLIWSSSKVSGTEKRRKTAPKEPNSPMKDDDRTRSVKLICKPSALANYLLKNCTSFNCYSPWVGWTWRTNAVLQSLYETCWSYGSPVHFVRDNLQLSDDGLVALDWAFPSYQKRRRTSSHATSPVLLIIPNSFGKITKNVLQVKWNCFYFSDYTILALIQLRESQYNSCAVGTAQ